MCQQVFVCMCVQVCVMWPCSSWVCVCVRAHTYLHSPDGSGLAVIASTSSSKWTSCVCAAEAFCCKLADAHTLHWNTHNCTHVLHMHAHTHTLKGLVSCSHMTHTHTLPRCAFLKYGDNLFVSWCLISHLLLGPWAAGGRERGEGWKREGERGEAVGKAPNSW